MLDVVFRPLRSVMDVGGRVISKPLRGTEHELTVVVDAIHRAAGSIEHHVEMIQGLATDCSSEQLWIARSGILSCSDSKNFVDEIAAHIAGSSRGRSILPRVTLGLSDPTSPA